MLADYNPCTLSITAITRNPLLPDSVGAYGLQHSTDFQVLLFDDYRLLHPFLLSTLPLCVVVNGKGILKRTPVPTSSYTHGDDDNKITFNLQSDIIL